MQNKINFDYFILNQRWMPAAVARTTNISSPLAPTFMVPGGYNVALSAGALRIDGFLDAAFLGDARLAEDLLTDFFEDLFEDFFEDLFEDLFEDFLPTKIAWPIFPLARTILPVAGFRIFVGAIY